MTDFGVYGRFDQLQQRITRLEQLLEAVITQTGVTVPPELADGDQPPDPVEEEIADLLRAGKKIDAVKVANKKLGMDLRDATEYVGRIEGSI